MKQLITFEEREDINARPSAAEMVTKAANTWLDKHRATLLMMEIDRHVDAAQGVEDCLLLCYVWKDQGGQS